LAWVENIGQPDPIYISPLIFASLAGVYLHWVLVKTKRQALLTWAVGVPLLFALVFQITFAGTLYLCFAITLLLAQRAYVTGLVADRFKALRQSLRFWLIKYRYQNIIPLAFTEALKNAGNKSYRLALMREAGLPVPNGAVMRTDVINHYASLAAAERKEFADTLWQIVGRKPCAVRSSAEGEDGAAKSFAGIFDSVLHVDRSTLESALECVIASFSSARAASYDHTQTLAKDANILVQEMIAADYAGVLFTLDPSAPGLLMIELAQGTGDDLVSGRVTPQNYRYGRYTKRPVTEAVPPIDLAALIALGGKIEALFNAPQDIEWAYKDGHFFILQSRDITSLSLGSDVQKERVAEWRRVFDALRDAPKDNVIIEQDEMSEVLPWPTPASLSLMSQMWAPGGSLDLACRELGVNYTVAEGKAGYLFTLFGKNYVDRQMKDAMALNVSASKAKQLRKRAATAPLTYKTQLLPALHEYLAPWQATDFHKIPLEGLKSCLKMFNDKLTHEVYAHAEQINILASFTLSEAQKHCASQPEQKDRLLHAELGQSPTGLLRQCLNLDAPARKSAAMAKMGHRAMFDYELSNPRYCEAPDLLWPLLDSITKSTHDLDDKIDFADPIDMAHALQNLKEHAKHESLKLVQLIRQVLLAIAQKTDLDGLIFQLSLTEIASISGENIAVLQTLANERKSRFDLLKSEAPKVVALSLFDCEVLSAPGLKAISNTSADMTGICVSGSAPVSSRAFIVAEDCNTPDDAFKGFQTGDIIVCHMVNPAWLPFIQKSSGILSEVGGWLSHMSIVAREHNLLMLVACKGMQNLETGDQIAVDLGGFVQHLPDPQQALEMAS
jgi:phosphohistidine swiveling domain-containing protein